MEINVENMKIGRYFDDEAGIGYAEITGTYRGKDFFYSTQGGRDEDGNFERVASPECSETHFSVGGKEIDRSTTICDFLGFDEELEDDVWEAFDKFIDEHLGPERSISDDEPIDHFGHEAEIRRLEAFVAKHTSWQHVNGIRKKHDDRDDYFQALEKSWENIQESQRDR